MASHLRTVATCYFLILLSNLPRTLSQAVSLLPTTPTPAFPACAFSCSNLNAASSYCLQTNVGASQETVDSCFCQRAEVTPFYTSPTGICDAFCVESDRSLLQEWFRDTCAAAGFTSDGATVTTLITSTRRPTSTATGTPQGSNSGANSSQDSLWYVQNPSWYQTPVSSR